MSSQGVSRTTSFVGFLFFQIALSARMMGHKSINYGNSKTFQGYSST